MGNQRKSNSTADTKSSAVLLKELGERVRDQYLTRENILIALLTGNQDKQMQIERIEALYHRFKNVVRYQQNRQAVYILIAMIQLGKATFPDQV